ncbi:MAG: hypothetical protein AAFO29_11775, partial [Actinomycetota bacterium]
MILNASEPIDLSSIFRTLRLFAELMYVDIPAGKSAFEHPKAIAAIDEAVEEFPGTVLDYVEDEKEIRRGLCWLLHQDDEALAIAKRSGGMPLASRLVDDHRRFLTMVWDSGFRRWQARPFPRVDYDVIDPGPASGVPVVLDGVVPVDMAAIFGLLHRSDAADSDALVRALGAQPSIEHDARLGMAWLLHEEDAELSHVLERGRVPNASPLGEYRQYLESVWDRLFADWRVEGFDPASARRPLNRWIV